VVAYRNASTTGIPLLHPWANRLAERRYRSGSIKVDLTDVVLPTDRNGLAIHGYVHAQPFVVVRIEPSRLIAELTLDNDALTRAAFPFPHRIRVDSRISDRALTITTTVTPTSRAAVPISFGWHPFLTLPGTPRSEWQLRLPACEQHILDQELIPTGATVRLAASDAPIAQRTYDDHFTLGRDRRFAISDEVRTVEIAFTRGYPHAQIYLPGPDASLTGDFICIEPMTASTSALVDGTAPRCASVDRYDATFAIKVA
jgi:galactose mutarotase-like enzyme